MDQTQWGSITLTLLKMNILSLQMLQWLRLGEIIINHTQLVSYCSLSRSSRLFQLCRRHKWKRQPLVKSNGLPKSHILKTLHMFLITNSPPQIFKLRSMSVVKMQLNSHKCTTIPFKSNNYLNKHLY